MLVKIEGWACRNVGTLKALPPSSTPTFRASQWSSLTLFVKVECHILGHIKYCHQGPWMYHYCLLGTQKVLQYSNM